MTTHRWLSALAKVTVTEKLENVSALMGLPVRAAAAAPAPTIAAATESAKVRRNLPGTTLQLSPKTTYRMILSTMSQRSMTTLGMPNTPTDASAMTASVALIAHRLNAHHRTTF